MNKLSEEKFKKWCRKRGMLNWFDAGGIETYYFISGFKQALEEVIRKIPEEFIGKFFNSNIEAYTKEKYIYYEPFIQWLKKLSEEGYSEE